MIQIQNVCKQFEQKPVLTGVDLTIEKGETVAVIGPSGCGKSTLLRLILGLEPVTSGRILVDGQNVAMLTGSELRRLRMRFGFVFQSSALFDSLTVGENVAFGLREHSNLTDPQIARVVAEKLELVGLKGTEKLLPAELSGGMQKRVSFARAIAHEPEVLLYDEPTTGLDPVRSTSIENLINKLDQELKVTAILVTHQLSTIFRCGDRIAMLYQGKIILAGSPEDAKQSNDPVIYNFIHGIDDEKIL